MAQIYLSPATRDPRRGVVKAPCVVTYLDKTNGLEGLK
jgi:hypothetical protein